MKRSRLLLLLIVVLSATSSQAQKEPPVSRFELRSTLLGKAVPYEVLYPINYATGENSERRFPVIYLLHGVTGHSSDWLAKTRIAFYANRLDLFIVMVEGANGWYTDSATVAEDKYESYILKELLPEVERRFRVSNERSGRAVAGLSMGGYGAIKFGLKHPELFAFAASMSGALDAPALTEEELKNWGVIKDSLLSTFGPATSTARATNDIFKLVRSLSTEQMPSLPFLYLDCGTKDPLFKSNVEFAALLVKRKVPHEYRQLPGNHDWRYWDQQIREILNLAVRRLAPPK